MKKILTIILCLCLLFSTTAMNAFASTDGGTNIMPMAENYSFANVTLKINDGIATAYVDVEGIPSKTSSTILNSTSDLKMAYNKVSYKVSATKKSGKWTINVVFSDTYDFDYISWKEYSGLGGTIVAIVNNYGATAQSVGAVVPYNIKVTVSSTYTN